MEFGRIAGIDDVNLDLPPDHPDTQTILAEKGAQGTEILIGLPNWGQDVAKRIYPKGTPAGRRLGIYSRMFNSVELNAIGYGVTPRFIPEWVAQTPPGFKFCPKVPRDITHGLNLAHAGELYEKFCGVVQAFGDRLGTSMLQFEEKSFGPWRFKELEVFLRAHGSRIPLAVEVRHKDWFAKEKVRESYFGLLAELGIGAIIVDAPGRRDLVHQRLTVPEAFIRFSGHDRGSRDMARVGDWTKRIESWMDMGLRRLHLFTHHVPDYLSADWAVDFIASMNRACGLDLKMPALVPETPKRTQLDIFADA